MNHDLFNRDYWRNRMKQVYQSFLIAFSMYSKLPMPYPKWTEENKKYVMCFFPLVGMVIGGSFIIWDFISVKIVAGTALRSVVYVVLPLLITGGIHMDGFMDTSDALASCQPMERKLEILKDSHAGAFAVMGCVVYLLLQFGIYTEIKGEKVYLIAVSFLLSRSLSAFSIVSFPMAKNSGFATMFQEEADKKIVKFFCYILIICSSFALIFIERFTGSMAILTAILTFYYYYKMSKKMFGGITGDLAGFFVQICELVVALVIILA